MINFILPMVGNSSRFFKHGYTKTYLATCSVFDIKNKLFSKVPGNLNKPRRQAGVLKSSEYLYVFGGIGWGDVRPEKVGPYDYDDWDE